MGDYEAGYLHFRIGSGRKGLDKVVIRLDPGDTYAVTLVRIDRKSWDVQTLYEVNEIYAEQLGEVMGSLAEMLKGREPQEEPNDNG